MEFSKRALSFLIVMYYLGLFSQRTPTQVEVCYHSKMKTRVGVPAKTVWDQCVEEIGND